MLTLVSAPLPLVGVSRPALTLDGERRPALSKFGIPRKNQLKYMQDVVPTYLVRGHSQAFWDNAVRGDLDVSRSNLSSRLFKAS